MQLRLQNCESAPCRCDIEKIKKPRNTGNETIQYLRDKSNKDHSLKQEKLQLKKQEADSAKAQTCLMQQTLVQHNQMMQQMMQAQQQQQQTALFSLVEKLYFLYY